jgi:hypothetical protein
MVVSITIRGGELAGGVVGMTPEQSGGFGETLVGFVALIDVCRVCWVYLVF